ncbi:MAG: glycosyltransferase, partial [Alsobacter sp.]
MARPRLLFVATEDWFFASHFLPMARAARELDFEVAVIARERHHRRIIEGAGARLIALEAERRSLDPRVLFRQILALKRLIEAERPDIL